jgi:hypothetical protein
MHDEARKAEVDELACAVGRENEVDESEDDLEPLAMPMLPQ